MSVAVQTSSRTSDAAWRERYVQNLGALYLTDPELAAQLDALPFSELPAVEPTRDGRLTVRVCADDGKPIYVHSRYRPEEEARQLIEQHLRKKPVGEDAVDLRSQCALIHGMGLGYVPAMLEQRLPKPLMIIAEDDLRLVKAALCVVDLREPMLERRLTILTSTSKSAAHARLRPVMTILLLGLHIIPTPQSRRYHAAFHQQMSKLMTDFMGYSRLQIVSAVRNARITCQNTAYNLPTYVTRPGVEVLEGRARGYPAVLVAAGPSLARNMHLLKGLRDRAVIIGVQTVFKPLMAAGIPPHFVTSLDYNQISSQFFEGVEDFGDTTLVAEPKVTWGVIDAFKGNKHVLYNDFAEQLLPGAAPRRGKLRPGSTVAHLSFYLAEHLGCDPIILVGQDLSFSDGLYYPPGMQVERIWGPELGRFCTIEMKQWERVTRNRHSLRRVKDVHGRDVYADEQMYGYAEQLETDIQASRARVIQTAEGGRLLAGAEVLPLREALERYCTCSLSPEIFESPVGAAAADTTAACAALEQRITVLTEVKAIAEETQAILGQLDGLLDRPAEFNRMVAKVDELRARMCRNDDAYNLVMRVAQLGELRRLQADRAIFDDAPETAETARRRLRRDREYVQSFAEGCAFLLNMLPTALERLREQP